MISLFLLCILMLGAVSAASDTGDIVEIDESGEQIIQADADLDAVANEESDDIALSEDLETDPISNDDGNIVGEASDAKNYSEFCAFISGKDEVILDSDYTFSDGDAYYYGNYLKYGIPIEKNITIDGNGHTINGNGIAKIFNIYGDLDVTLKNLNLINGFNTNSYSYGGAIDAMSINLTIINCNFTNNVVAQPNYYSFGGAIYARDATVNVINSTFSNCYSNSEGGAIYIDYKCNVTIIGSTFKDNNASSGGAIYIRSNSILNIADSEFYYNTANNGAAIFEEIFYYDNTYPTAFINNCTFVGKPGSWTDGLRITKSNCSITNSTFIDSRIYFYGNDNKVEISNSVLNNSEVSDSVSVSDDCQIFFTPEFTIYSIDNFTIGSSIEIYLSERYDYTGVVTVSIGNESYEIDLNNGWGSKVVTPNIAPGTYKAIIKFAGSGNYVSAYAESNEFIVNTHTNLVAYDKTVSAPKYKTYKLTLKTKAGKVIKNTKVTLKIGKYTVKAKTNSKGVATFKILYSKIKAAERSSPYKVTAKIIKNKKVKTLKNNKLTLKVDGKTYNLKSNAKGTAVFKAKKPASIRKYYVTLKDKSGNLISKTSISLKVNGKTFKATTNAKGQALFKINNLNKNGKFKVDISFAGNTKYIKSSKTTYITIKDR